ncbi:DUF2946 domain-containing protein [Microvirga tunisiensis]|uniref:DUF2946 domain-containing protein n=2 Tax=Pannonibacter tanglangensis TaxID=2750084 RepID=A0ABW9ZLH2_9HYPH|nr:MULTISPECIES: DUF2946 family protein [unclassified Pannonibacter]NBN64888.1 DUF2946 domain-containing protein [Pannonibacter sp. XCT-34]NBN79391.1 DUF2946 domain-containing protein [Pannonibacter sp. XCT-53]
MLAVLLWSLIPTGFMPAVSTDGGFTIVICSPDSPDGVRTIQVDADGRELPASAPDTDPGSGDGHRSGDHGNPCIFAAVLALGLPASGVLPAPAPDLVAQAASPVSDSGPPSLFLRPVGARAPPVVV